jgi:hypothetical protein
MFQSYAKDKELIEEMKDNGEPGDMYEQRSK